ncbi:YgjV family protein [Candidatus Saccharibacteria bacterium]|nr:YgjV family protein [Candidatus Saccharibacteria bacterium]
MILIIVATIPTYTEPLSAMSAVATVLYTLSLWQKKPIMYKVLGIPSCAAQVIYHVFIWNLSGIVLEGLVLVVSIIGLGLDVERRRKARKK